MAFKILDNLTYKVKFLYDSPKVWDNTDDQGKAYKTYSYGVEINKKNEYLGVSEPVHKMLQSFGRLSGRTFEVSKVQDPGDLKKKHWIFKENGVELNTSSTKVPNQEESTASGQGTTNFLRPRTLSTECEVTFEKMRVAFRRLESRVEALETLIQHFVTKEAKTLHSELAGKSKTIQSVADQLGGVVIDEVPEGFDK